MRTNVSTKGAEARQSGPLEYRVDPRVSGRRCLTFRGQHSQLSVGMSVQTIQACRRCGLSQRLGPAPAGCELVCARCGAVLRSRWTMSLRWSAALALAALILY